MLSAFAGRFEGGPNLHMSRATSRSRQGAKVTGRIRAESVAIAGEVEEGNIDSAKKVDLLASGVLKATSRRARSPSPRIAHARTRGVRLGRGARRDVHALVGESPGLVSTVQHARPRQVQTRTCPHCRAVILQSSATCPSCKKHLKVAGDDTLAPNRRFPAPRGRRDPPPSGGEAWEYSAVVTITNDKGEEIGRHIVGVGALQPGEGRTFSFAVEVFTPNMAATVSQTDTTPARGVGRLHAEHSADPVARSGTILGLRLGSDSFFDWVRIIRSGSRWGQTPFLTEPGS